MSSTYNPLAVMQALGAHLDAMDDPNHGLANHSITGDLVLAKGRNGGTGNLSKVQMMNNFAPFVHALNDPNHELANHPGMQAVRQFADMVHAHAPALAQFQPPPTAQPQPSGFSGTNALASAIRANGPSGVFPMNPSISPARIMPDPSLSPPNLSPGTASLGTIRTPGGSMSGIGAALARGSAY